MTRWSDTLACESRAACRECRASRSFRESVAAAYGGPVDFDCPVGLPIVGQRWRLGDRISWLLSLLRIKKWDGCRCDERRSWINRHEVLTLFLSSVVVGLCVAFLLYLCSC